MQYIGRPTWIPVEQHKTPISKQSQNEAPICA